MVLLIPMRIQGLGDKHSTCNEGHVAGGALRRLMGSLRIPSSTLADSMAESSAAL